MWMNVECWNNFLLSKSVCSGNAAIPRKGSSPLGHFLGNDQGRRGGRLYSPVLKIQDCILTILGMMLHFLS